LKKQATVATSLVKAEYIAFATATKKVIWLYTLLKKLNFLQTTATIINTDNWGCIVLANNLVSYSHAKHIDIHYHFIWECIEQAKISFRYVSTKIMLADIFTKSLPHKSFIQFQTRLGILNIP